MVTANSPDLMRTPQLHKHPQLKALPITLAEIKNLQQAQAQKDQAAAEANE